MKQKPKTSKVSLGTLYDINKNAMKSIKELSYEERVVKRKLVEDFITDTHNHYYMLLCNERKDYTVFHTTVLEDKHSVPNELMECLTNRGLIYGIDRTEDGVAIEIWLMIDNEPYCYYFFPYDEAIVEC